jgi:uncharacterized protein
MVTDAPPRGSAPAEPCRVGGAVALPSSAAGVVGTPARRYHLPVSSTTAGRTFPASSTSIDATRPNPITRSLARSSIRAIAWTFLLAACASAQKPTAPAASERPLPIIDMHMHARVADHYGPPPLLMCVAGEDMPVWDPAQPIEGIFPTQPDARACKEAIWSAETDHEVMAQTIAVMERHNIYGVLGGHPELVATWVVAAPGRFIPALDFRLDRATGSASPGVTAVQPYEPISPETMRALHQRGKLQVLGEVLNAYGGIAPDDERMAPYWALAEELDIPVGIHLGPGIPGEVYLGNPRARARLQSALTLEEVLVRYPRLRVYIMHAGYPMLEDLRALLFSYPQVYVDVSIIATMEPRAAFYRYLRGIVEAGYGRRVMFGSDQMVWPGLIEATIAAIEDAPFLSKEQKRDIFYNNAARFLRLSDEEIARHHGREP